MIFDNNFIDDEKILELQNILYRDPKKSVSWKFSPQTNNIPDYLAVINNKNVNDSFQFEHKAKEQDAILSNFSQNAEGLLSIFAKKNNVIVDNIFRIKSNIIVGNTKDENGYHFPHVDSISPHYVFLYYVNNSDGDTIFFNEFFNGQKIKNLTESVRVKPEAGLGIVFDGLQYHASSSPLNSNFRCVININFTGSINL
jgi:hypothetical protein